MPESTAWITDFRWLWNGPGSTCRRLDACRGVLKHLTFSAYGHTSQAIRLSSVVYYCSTAHEHLRDSKTVVQC